MASELELKESEELIDRMNDDIASLRQQLAECQQKNKELNLDAAIGRVPMDSKDFAWEKRLAECQQQRDDAINHAKNNELMIAECKRELAECEAKLHGLSVDWVETKHKLMECERERDGLQYWREIDRADAAELVSKLAAVTKERDELLAAAQNLIRVKGRHHTEQAYKMLEVALAKAERRKAGQVGTDKTGDGSCEPNF